MDAVDWTALSALAAISIAGLGYLARRLERLETRMEERFDRIEERYVRHLEMHAGS